MKILPDLERLLRSNLSFCLYALPNSQELRLFVKSKAEVASGELFLMYPYSLVSKAKQISWSPSFHGLAKDFRFTEEFQPRPILVIDSKTEDLAKDTYFRAIETIKSKILQKEYQKVVLTRQSTVMQSSNPLEVFMSCLNEYQSAFRYLTCDADGACWLGASPELLLERNGGEYQTVSLAGTRSAGQVWTDKEYMEQQIVTDFICKNLSDLGIEEVHIGETEDIVAGAITHLKTKIRFPFSGEESVLLQALHPTPAVCGSPRTEAMKAISNLESNDRRYYTGFIGIQEEDASRYFVNLRCASFYSNATLLYAGGGIVEGSDPVSEWEETEKKMNTLKRFL